MSNATTLVINDYDSTKESKFTQFGGDTFQQTYTGKNKFNINNVISSNIANVTVNVNGNILTLTALGNTGAQYGRIIIENLDAAKSYTFSFKAKKIKKGEDGGPYIRVFTYGSNNGTEYSLISNLENQNPTEWVEYSLSRTFTGYSYYRFFIYNNGSTPVTIGEQTQYYDIQFEEGTKVTDYEPFVGNQSSPNPDYPQDIKVVTGLNNIIISNKDGSQAKSYEIDLNDLELAKIDNYKDYIYKNGDNWYKHSVVGKILFDGSENWTYNSVTGSYVRMERTISNCKLYSDNSSTEIVIKSNYFNGISASKIADKANNIAIISNNRFLVITNVIEHVSVQTDNANLKAWLSTHNTVVYYVLETPTNELITDKTLISQLNAISEATGYEDTMYITSTNENDLAIVPTYHYNFVTPAPSPDRPSEVKVVTRENKVKIQNKNLFDEDLILSISNWLFKDGYYNGLAASLRRYFLNNPILNNEFEENTQYALQWQGYSDSSVNIRFYVKYTDGTTDNFCNLTTTNGLKTGVTASGKTVSSINFDFGNDGNVYIKNLQIEKGSTATSYVAHQEQVYSLSLGNLELCKIGDYKDYIYGKTGKWYVHKKIGKVDLSELDWRLYSNVFYANITNILSTVNNTKKLLSNKYSVMPSTEGINSYNNNYVIWQSSNSSSLKRICVKNTDYTSSVDFKMGNAGTILYYPSETSTDTLITDPTLIQQLNDLYYAKSYQGISYITVDTENEQPILSIDYKKSNLLRIKALEEANS